MPEVIYVESDGTRHQVDVPVGTNLMQGALNHMIPGIEGDCGGLCACGTCHVYIDQEWAQYCKTPDELESGILDFAFDVDQRSRLSCQVEMQEVLAGLVVYLPVRQY